MKESTRNALLGIAGTIAEHGDVTHGVYSYLPYGCLEDALRAIDPFFISWEGADKHPWEMSADRRLTGLAFALTIPEDMLP